MTSAVELIERSRRITRARARASIDACGLSPARASRASERVYRLGVSAQGREEYALARDYFTLSSALNERRHALIQYGLSEGKGNEAYAEHSREVQHQLGRLPEVSHA